MPAPTGPRRGGGIRKHQSQRRDRDGDLVMGASPRVATTSGPKKPQTSAASRNLTELRVTGWTDDSDIDKVVKFLDRHAGKRSLGAKSGGVHPNMIKRSRVVGGALVINVRPEDVPSFGKINGFSFASPKHGSQKLTITGPGIRSKSPTEIAAGGIANKDEMVSTLTTFLERRYDASQKLLNLSRIADDDQVSATGVFTNEKAQSKFIPVLMTIIERQLKTLEQKQEAIHSVTLSNNNLPSLNLVRDIAFTLPHIKNLDLSGNKFTNVKDLLLFKNKLRHLEHLILKDNPLDQSQADWQQEIVGWFPRLRILNDQTVRTDEQIARLDAPKQTPVPSQTNLWLDGDKVAQNFIVDFIQGFDNDRNNLIQKYYDHASIFTMSVNARARGGAGHQHDRTPWDSYLPQSRNLKFIHGKRVRFNRQFRGAEKIQKAWSDLPPTRHPGLDTNKYSMDCQPQPGLPDPTGQYSSGVTGLLVVIHGEYEEHRTAKGANEIVRRAFDRTFILGPGGPSGVRVVSDMCCLRAAGGAPAWIPTGAAQETAVPAAQSAPASQNTLPTPAGTLTPEQEALALHVHQATKLTPELAIQCLEAGNWNLDAAAQIFEAQKDKLPPEAFVST